MTAPLIPAVWCDGTMAVQARAYAALFPGATIDGRDPAVWVPGGLGAMLSLDGCPVQLIEGGPRYRPTPAVSLFVQRATEGEVRALWEGLADGGAVLMPLEAWPWARLYGWVQDRWGLSWQVNLGPLAEVGQAVLPYLTFTGPAAGRARAALELYARAFPDLMVDALHDHDGSGPDPAGTVMHAQVRLRGGTMMLSDSAHPHAWGFTPGTSLSVLCPDQAEVDRLWALLLADGGTPSRCGWLTDPFGLSWQIVPQVLHDIMNQGTPDQKARAVAAFLPMVKLDGPAIAAAAGVVEGWRPPPT